jgi:quercetin dioxygenase-like cupin family protein
MKQTDLFANGAAALPRSTTVLQESGLRVLLLHLKPGERLPEHQTRGAITVQCLQGEVSFASGEETVELRPGLLLSLPPGAPHGLEARKDALLLVTLALSDANS